MTLMHPKDEEYRGEQNGIGSHFETIDDFFPFTHPAINALRYMRWVLGKYDVEEWKKRKF